MTVRRHLKKYVAAAVVGSQVAVAGLLSIPALAAPPMWRTEAMTGVNSQINAASQNNTEIWQQWQGGQPSNGWMNTNFHPTANTSVNNGVNAAAQNNTQMQFSNPWGWNSGSYDFTANTGVNNAVNAASQNNVSFWQEGNGAMNASFQPAANTSVNNNINAASQNNVNGWWH